MTLGVVHMVSKAADHWESIAALTVTLIYRETGVSGVWLKLSMAA